MTKGKWLLALFLIILAAACGDKSASPGPVADTPENRKAAAKRYLEAVPPQELLRNITGNMVQRLPEQARKQFREAMDDKELLKNTYRISEEALVKHFTPDELNAMATFFGSPAGKSARIKFSPYMMEIIPQINGEVKKVFAKRQERPKPGSEKEGAPKAAEQSKPEQPKAEPSKPEQVKPAQPETPQPEPKKPEAKQPKAEHPKAEHPKPEKPTNK
ncbi:MAG: DUF2059 domain-containing protein [Deltaproteobacteria bacterium]|nr:DUF2059 domain-containing protein [Deltaproteobacteria bacterium]